MFGKLNGQARSEIDVSLDTLGNIILLARAYDAGLGDAKAQEIRPGSSSSLAHDPGGQAPRDLRDAINALSEDEQAVLVALSLIGRGKFGPQEFDQALIMAFDRRGAPTSDYLLGLPMLADLLEIGASACGADLGTAPLRSAAKPNGAAH